MLPHLEGQPHIKTATGKRAFVVAWAFYPDRTAMGVNGPFRDRQPEAGPSPFELGRARRMQHDLPGLIEFVKHQGMMLWIDTNAGVRESKLYHPLALLRLNDAATDVDAAAVGRVLDRIHDQMVKRLVKKIAVPQDKGEFTQPFQFKAETASIQGILESRLYLLDQNGDRNRHPARL